ncbi:MAG: LysR family transcriptional regulator [Planctomycetia bacterium]|nr:LysR family transcriptional regulator [Planctomycetia bacterium]
MDWLNYHHLLYFWTVAKESSVSKAADMLHVAQPTVSAQIRALERSLGQKLFERQGRRLRLSVEGESVFRYADDIFALGRELLQTVKGEPQAAPKRFRIGISDALPKLTTYRLLEPALVMQPSFRLHVRIDKTERLLGELAVHAVDLVIADAPMMPSLRVRAFNHLLGETSVSVFGDAALAKRVRRGFPGSLHGAPMLLQTTNTAMRQSLDQWFDAHGIQPSVVGEVEDMAMLQTLGEHGLGLFAAPTVVRKEICRRYHVVCVGELERVREKFYAISVERRLTHPAVRLIADQAKRRLFG